MQKNPTLRLVVVLIFACVTGHFAQSQTRRRTPAPQPTTNVPAQTTIPARKRPVTISTKSGDTVSGNFILANGDSVRIEVEGTPRNIKLDDVASIVFNDEGLAEGTNTPKRTVKLSTQASAAARDALKALRKIAGATEIGVSFQEYGSRLIDAKADVDNALASIPDGELKNELAAAMDAYADAGQAWNVFVQHGRDWGVLVAYSPLPEIQKKYSIPFDNSLADYSKDASSRDTILNKEVTLSTIWAAARKHLDSASTLLNQ